MRVSCVSLVGYAPVASTPSTCLGIPSPAGGAPALVTFLGEPRFFSLQGGPSSVLGKRDRLHGTSHEEASTSAWAARKPRQQL